MVHAKANNAGMLHFTGECTSLDLSLWGSGADMLNSTISLCYANLALQALDLVMILLLE